MCISAIIYLKLAHSRIKVCYSCLSLFNVAMVRWPRACVKLLFIHPATLVCDKQYIINPTINPLCFAHRCA
jgi:hypothetical protein